ncbi:MAG TPA: hypothetical protein VHZ81_09870 [Galbitalea sp.]|jgi:hypothetical protein|nr:hypothetical protein [Galbitalea sp.]
MSVSDALSRGIDRGRLFYSEEETAALLGIHRTTLRMLALDGRAPVEPVRLTQHKRVYRRIDVERLAGVTE